MKWYAYGSNSLEIGSTSVIQYFIQKLNIITIVTKYSSKNFKLNCKYAENINTTSWWSAPCVELYIYIYIYT